MKQEYIDEYNRRTGGDIFKLAWSHLTPEQIFSALDAHNPLKLIDQDENVIHTVLRMMKTPEYLFFAAKVLLGIELHPFQALILEELWKRPYPMLIGSRGLSKTFLMAVLTLLKLRLIPGTKIVGCGTSFRQSRIIWEYCVDMIRKAPILESTFSKDDGPLRQIDRCVIHIGDSVAYFLPIGSGSTIRGLRANCTIADEFNDMNPEIFETVISGFGATPKNPVANNKLQEEREAKIKAGVWTKRDEDNFSLDSNQTIITGTCGYDFEHFARYYRTYKSIINSGGDYTKLPPEDQEKYGGLDHNDFSIIRLPAQLLPSMFMDEKTIAKNKASMTSDAFLREYSTIFVKDSQGFFKKSLVESCVASDKNEIEINGNRIYFTAKMKGESDKKYVMAVDPASERDNLAIILLELHDDHTRIVYCWTINRKKFEKRVSSGVITEHDYFQFCVQKIRDLCKAFNVAHIVMDAQGGGITLQQALASPRNGEEPIYEIIEKDKEKSTDRLAGRHILEMFQFSNAKRVAEANHGLLFDFQNKLLLFPDFDPVVLELSYQQDYSRAKEAGITSPDMMSMFDTFEDCVLEIEMLKDELVTITHTMTPTGQERWDTPDVMTAGKKGKARKDRYSALVMGNLVSRTTGRIIVEPPKYSIYGVKVGESKNAPKAKGLYNRGWSPPSGRVQK